MRFPPPRSKHCGSHGISAASSSRRRTRPRIPGISTLTLKVPTVNVQDAVVRLSGLGKIVSQQVQIDDLQGQIDDLTKRETALRERIARLSARLAGPGLDAETRATLEARRDAARSELAQARVARAQVNAEARYATIQLSLQTSQSSAVPVEPTRWKRGLDRAGEILLLEAMIVLYALVIVGPLALLAVLAWLGQTRTAAEAGRAAPFEPVVTLRSGSAERGRGYGAPSAAVTGTSVGNGSGRSTVEPTSTADPSDCRREDRPGHVDDVMRECPGRTRRAIGGDRLGEIVQPDAPRLARTTRPIARRRPSRPAPGECRTLPSNMFGSGSESVPSEPSTSTVDA